MSPRGAFDRWGTVLVIASIAVVFVINLVELADFDVFLHLAVGDWILEHGSVPRTGLFSATRGDAPWVDNEWGFQVLASLAHRADGVRGLVLLAAALPTLAATLLSLALRRPGMPRSAVALGVALSGVALGSLHFRPQLVTYVFLAAFLWGLTAILDSRSRLPLVAMPVLAALWSNVHGGFVVGIAVLAIPVAVELVRRAAGRPPSVPLSSLGTALGLSSLAVFANPYGWRQVVYPLHYLLRPEMTSFNLEWQPTVLAERPQLAALLALAGVVLALSPRRPTAHELVTTLAFAAMAVKANRHVGLAAIVVPWAIAPCGQSLLLGALREESRVRRIAFSLGVGAFIAAGLFWVRDLPARSPFHFDRSLLLPVESADFLAAHRPPGRLFNQYGWGDFLIYRFRPDAVVFVDGRNDLYGEAFMAEYLAVMAGDPGAEQVLDRYGVGHALLAYHPNNARLIRLLLDAGWVCIHRSADFVPIVVLARRTEEARELIAAFGMPLAPP